MAGIKLGFEDFIDTVDCASREFVQELQTLFMEQGCKIEVKEAKSGFVVSYLWNKKTVMNYVFRKKGLLVRIYANHIGQYLELLETLPDGMAEALHAAPDCKRLTGAGTCNPKCAMGYDFPLRGERHQKCRYGAFQFPVCEENNPAILTLLTQELAAYRQEC